MRFAPNRFSGWVYLAVCFAAFAIGKAMAAEAARTFTEGRCGAAQLQYFDDVPVLSLCGDPDELGRQQAVLVGGAVRRFIEFPRQFARSIGLDHQVETMLDRGNALWRKAPEDYRRELQRFAQEAKIDERLLIGANTLMDVYRAGWGCSSLTVSGARSTSGEPTMARNLDFPSLGLLHRHSIVIVYRPTGKRAFAAVSFAGLIGVLSGMNESGLAVAVHNVYRSADGASLFSADGEPYTLLFRRILEQCDTVSQAETMLRGSPRSTMLNLAVCDPKSAAVFELTPKTVARREFDRGLLPCTNHFRTKELSVGVRCQRYETLLTADRIEKLDIATLRDYLHRVHQGFLTIQSMVFEPVGLRLHVALSEPPVSDGPYRVISLRELFDAERFGPSKR